MSHCFLKIQNLTQKTFIAIQSKKADTFGTRLIGLLSRHKLNAGEALIITRCQCVHMLFMRFAIDVIFVDKDDWVIGLVPHLKPFQFSPYYLKASYAIECPVGTIGRTLTKIGDKIQINYVDLT